MQKIELEDYEVKLLIDCLDQLEDYLSDMICNDLYIENLPINKKQYKEFSKKFHQMLLEVEPYYIEQVKADFPKCKIVKPEYMGNYAIALYFKEKFKKLKNRK